MTAAKEMTNPDCRRRKILEEASQIFLEKGYERACIDDLIARVGGSKRTIYNEFGSKEGLFTAMITQIVDDHARIILKGLDIDEQSGVSLRQAVLDHGRHLVHVVFAPDVLAFYRTIIAEGQRFPNLAKAFYDAGPARSMKRFAEVLERFREKGEIDVDDCDVASQQFAGLIRDGHHLAILLGLAPPPCADEMEARAQMATDIFLKGVVRS